MIKRTLTVSVAAVVVASTGALASSSRPDLEVAWMTSPPSVLPAGESFDVAARIRNAGRSRARHSTTAFYLTASPRRQRGRTLLAQVRTRGLRPGRSSLRSARVTVPPELRPGEYFVVVCPDARRRVREADERHNCAASADYVAVDVAR